VTVTGETIRVLHRPHSYPVLQPGNGGAQHYWLPSAATVEDTPLPRKTFIISDWDQPDAARFRRDLVGARRVPSDVAELMVTLNAGGQTEGSEVASFDDMRLAKFAS